MKLEKKIRKIIRKYFISKSEEKDCITKALDEFNVRRSALDIKNLVKERDKKIKLKSIKKTQESFSDDSNQFFNQLLPLNDFRMMQKMFERFGITFSCDDHQNIGLYYDDEENSDTVIDFCFNNGKYVRYSVYK